MTKEEEKNKKGYIYLGPPIIDDSIQPVKSIGYCPIFATEEDALLNGYQSYRLMRLTREWLQPKGGR